MVEEWRSIPGYEGYYSASNLGKVKRIARKVPRKDGITMRVRETLLKPCTGKDGRMRVSLCKDATQKTFTVHRLVCLAFLPNPYNNPLNNCLSNLEWCTYLENTKHCQDQNRMYQFAPRYASQETIEIARRLKVCRGTISKYFGPVNTPD